MSNKACPECQKNNHDSAGDHLWLMADGATWCCTRTDYHDSGKNYYSFSESLETEVEGDIASLIQEEVHEEVHEEPTVPSSTMASLSIGGATSFTNSPSVPTVATGALGTPVDITAEYRGIKPSTFKHYNTKGVYQNGKLYSTQHSLLDEDGNAVTTKVRKLPKDIFLTGKTGQAKIQLFGQSIFTGAKKLLITEGEYDAMSAWQMFQGSKFTKNVSVISLPQGANVSAMVHQMKYLKNFKEIYVSVDNDDAGKKVAKDIANLLPDAKFLSFSEKDANAMLVAGKEKEFVNSLFTAEVWKPETIVRIGSIIDEVLAKPVAGEPWPWPSLTKATYGRRGGEGMFVGAGVKCGKSEWINQVIAHDVKMGKPLGVIKFEEIPAMTVKRVAGKLDGIFYHKPGIVYADADLEATVKTLEHTLILHRAFGTANWDTVKDFIRYCVLMGCKTIIIDPITKITNGLTPSETETELRRFSDELACMAQDMDFFYIVSCHLKAPASGPSHERGGRVETYQFRGSRAMAENCYYFLGIERDKDPNLPEDDRNTSTFVLLEDRAFGNVCKFPVFYSKTDQSYLEPTITF